MRDKLITIRCTEKEREEIVKEAEKYKLPVAQYIRLLIWNEKRFVMREGE